MNPLARVAALALASVLAALPGIPLANLGARQDPALDEGRRAIEAGDWPGALSAMRKVVAADPGNADAHNWMGFAYRKMGRLEESFAAYREALRLDPGHRSAHEYVGEAYLAAGQPDQAERHLAELRRLCSPLPCEEIRQLERAIAEYRKARP